MCFETDNSIQARVRTGVPIRRLGRYQVQVVGIVDQ